MNEIGIQYTLQTSDQALINHLVQESKVVLAVLECPTDTVLDEIFLQLHQTVHIQESNLWLYHPELSQVARSITVLCTEGWTEGVDSTECRSTQLTLQLTGNGQ